MSHENQIVNTSVSQSSVRYVPALGASIGCGAEVVAAVWAETGAIAASIAEDPPETDCGEDGEEQSEVPVWEPEAAKSLWREIGSG